MAFTSFAWDYGMYQNGNAAKKQGWKCHQGIKQ